MRSVFNKQVQCFWQHRIIPTNPHCVVHLNSNALIVLTSSCSFDIFRSKCWLNRYSAFFQQPLEKQLWEKNFNFLYFNRVCLSSAGTEKCFKGSGRYVEWTTGVAKTQECPPWKYVLDRAKTSLVVGHKGWLVHLQTYVYIWERERICMGAFTRKMTRQKNFFVLFLLYLLPPPPPPPPYILCRLTLKNNDLLKTNTKGFVYQLRLHNVGVPPLDRLQR